jgi:hypothetical protein
MNVLFVVGWGDTATMIVLSHALYIDTFVWMAPNNEVQLAKLPQKFKPLRFRRGKESSARKLYLRFINEHFVVYKPRTAGTKVQPGSAADEEHYFYRQSRCCHWRVCSYINLAWTVQNSILLYLHTITPNAFFARVCTTPSMFTLLCTICACITSC